MVKIQGHMIETRLKGHMGSLTNQDVLGMLEEPQLRIGFWGNTCINIFV